LVFGKGALSPRFYTLETITGMTGFEDKMKKAITESVSKNPDLFIVKMDIKPDRNVSVTIDGHKPVPLSECIRITRDVEAEIDRDEYDYALTVGTFDITQWFEDKRQFDKNLNRKLKVKTGDKEFEGKLVEINEQGIVLEEKVREPKPVGKGKHTVTKRYEIPFENIKKAKVIISF
jgi:ribosome maturation factor RimP